MLRPAKHHVFERMREARFARRFVERTEAVPNVGLDDGRGMVLDDEYLQAVGERLFRDCVCAVDVCASAAAARGASAARTDRKAMYR